VLPWSSGFEAVFYFYAAGSLIAYMMKAADAERSSEESVFDAIATSLDTCPSTCC